VNKFKKGHFMFLSSKSHEGHEVGFLLGAGFDFVFVNDDYVIFSSQGSTTRIGIGPVKSGQEDNLPTGGEWEICSLVDDQKTAIFIGSYTDATRLFNKLKASVVANRPKKSTWKASVAAFGGGVVLAGIFALTVMVCSGSLNRPTTGAENPSQKLLQFIQMMNQRNAGYRNLSGLPDAQNPSGGNTTNPGANAPQKQMPMNIKPNPEPVTQKDGTPVTLGNDIGLPSYSPDLYKDDTQKGPQTAPKSETTDGQNASKDTKADSKPSTVPAPPELKSEKSFEATPKSNSEVSKPDAEKVNTDKPGSGDQSKADNTLKDAVASNLKGMSAEQAADALRKISMLSPDQLQGQSLDSLPVEIQSLIKKAVSDSATKTAPQKTSNATDSASSAPGELTTDGNGVPTKLIILPTPVIDQYRTDDGIASIPENQSWQARGNPTVHLPLPGGGDVKSVDDLKKFGFEP
jgi:hypothetical protein